MRVGVVNNYRAQSISFGNLTKEEKAEFIKTKQEALDVIGKPNKSVFIYSSACLPQAAENNTGTGTLLTKQGDEFLDVVKTFTTANVIQDLPSGELLPKPARGFYSAYEASADGLSTHLIEPEVLMDESFGKIITPEELKTVVDANNGETKNVLANFENVVEPDSPFENMLKKAYERFKTGEGEKLDALRKEFSDYSAKNSDWLEGHGIFDVLSKKYNTQEFDKWENEVDKRLYDVDYSEELRTARKNEILKESAEDIDFYKFKKFMADKCLDMAREKAHEKGLKFGGDIAYQFSLSDIFTNPKAFSYDVYMGPLSMKIPALNFYQITDPNSPAAKMLAQKVRHAANRYDTLRVDMGWGYVTPLLGNSDGSYKEKKEMGSAVLDFIENTVKEVKGENYNRDNIFYEVEASGDDFRAFNDDNSIIQPLKDRVKIYSSDYMSEGWGSSRAYSDRFHLSPDEYMYGASTQDTTPLRELASSEVYAARKADQVKVLSDILKINPESLQNGDEFIRAKNAEPLLAKNQFMFFTEFFGNLRKFSNPTDNGAENYRTKIPANPEQAYYDAVKEGKAYNLMDGLEKVFKAKGFDEKYPVLFEKIVEFKNKLYDIKPEAKPVEAKPVDVVPEEVKPEVKPEVAPEVKPEVAPEVKPEVQPNVASEVESSVEPAFEGNKGAAQSAEAVAQEVKSGAEAVAETVSSSASSESKPATEAITKTAKKARFTKPLLITAGVLVVLYAAYEKFIKKHKAA